jgi:TonB family protein
MKSILSLGLMMLAFSLCNLVGKRTNSNVNSNTPRSGTTTETAPSQNANAAESEQAPRRTAGSDTPKPIRSQNSGVPSISDVPASEPPPPAPKQKVSPNVPHPPISGGVLNGKAISLPKPAYPPVAKAAHASGTVTVQVLVDENGNVVSAHAVSGHPLLQQSAVNAARQARFSPTKLSGQPVKVTGVIIYNFAAQ